MNETTRWITTEVIDIGALLAETADPACGAAAVFLGTVREHNEGRPVNGMTYDAHVTMAARVLRTLEATVCERFDARHCRIVHRVGPMGLEDISVAVVVRSPHRAASFEAARYAIDTLKQTVPIWKEEHYTDGTHRHLEGTPLSEPQRDDG